MRNVSPWLVRRSPKHYRRFQVVSFNEGSNVVVVAKEFDDVDEAQEFAKEANRMIMRTTDKN